MWHWHCLAVKWITTQWVAKIRTFTIFQGSNNDFKSSSFKFDRSQWFSYWYLVNSVVAATVVTKYYIFATMYVNVSGLEPKHWEFHYHERLRMTPWLKPKLKVCKYSITFAPPWELFSKYWVVINNLDSWSRQDLLLVSICKYSEIIIWGNTVEIHTHSF